MEKLTILPLIAESGNGESQKMGFFFKEETWDRHLSKNEEEALKSFDEIEARRKKLSPIERRYTSNQLERKYGRSEAIGLILNEVYNNNPPIREIKKNCQLEFKFL